MMDQPIMAFDLNAACSGFLYALQCACAMLEEGACALVIGAENLSKIIDWSDRGTCILFGDGAGAALIRRSKQGKHIWHFAQSKGDPKRVLDIPGKTLSDVPCVNGYWKKVRMRWMMSTSSSRIRRTSASWRALPAT